MNINYKIIEVYEDNRVMVVRYFTDVVTEQDLDVDPNTTGNGTPKRCKSDVSLSIPLPEPTEEEFNAEIKKAQDKSEGKDKAEVAKASVQAVKNEEVEVIDADEINGVEEVTIDERHMSDAEMNKREKIVKSMKKGLSGFKQRYGDRAKNVMYATATKQAMKD